MAAFDPGDVVRLKSGGPAMTVTSVEEKDGKGQPIKEEDQRVYCCWFTDDQTAPRRDDFPAAALDDSEPDTVGGKKPFKAT